MLNKMAMAATSTAVAMAAACPSTADQSAPPSARNVHGCHSRADSNGPRSHPPSFATSIDEPVTTMPIANTTTPIPSTIGMTSGFFTSRTANSKTRPNASAVSECLSASEWSMSPIVRRWTSIPDAT